MVIFERLGDLIWSNVNDLLDRAEDPEKMAKQVIIDMEEQLRDATSGYATAMAGVNKVKKQMEQALAQKANSDALATTYTSNEFFEGKAYSAPA